MNNERDLEFLDQYIDTHIRTKTTRHASEERFEAPPLYDAKTGLLVMRDTINKTLGGFKNSPDTSVRSVNFDQLFEDYRSTSKEVPEDYGTHEDWDIDDYLHVGQDRDYDSIVNKIRESHPITSIPNSFIDIVEKYKDTYAIEGHEAARMSVLLVSRKFEELKSRTSSLMQSLGVDIYEASSRAFRSLALEMDYHIADIDKEMNSGIPLKQAHAKTLTPRENLEMSDFLLSEEDAIGLSEAYHLQGRPYRKDELRTAEWLLSNNPNLRKSLIIFHQRFVDYSTEYMRQHPERLNHSLEPFSEIFLNIPTQEEPEIMRLVPNPKLLRVMSNNIVPGIAREYLLDYSQDDELDPMKLTADQIKNGSDLVKKLGLFQTTIASYNKTDGDIRLSMFFPRTCPAMTMFSDSVITYLPEVYDNLQST